MGLSEVPAANIIIAVCAVPVLSAIVRGWISPGCWSAPAFGGGMFWLALKRYSPDVMGRGRFTRSLYLTRDTFSPGKPRPAAE